MATKKRRTRIQVKTVRTIPQFLQAVLRLRSAWFPDTRITAMWFRGSENADYHLMPGAYWRRRYNEQTIYWRFRSLVPSYLPRQPEDEWDWYYLMQHYGLPTRLLDWSENPLVALFFALTKEPGSGGAVVWALDPTRLNQASQKFHGRWVITPDPVGEQYPATYWLPTKCGRGKKIHTFDKEKTDWLTNANPLAIMPRRANPRIVAQSGVFTVHGVEEVPLDEFVRRNADERAVPLAKILVQSDSRVSLLRDLHAVGISKTALFPEAQSIAEDLRLQHDF